jgi:hypothetical protein
VAAGLAGKIVFTGDKVRKACDREGVGHKIGHKNRGKSGVIP